MDLANLIVGIAGTATAAVAAWISWLVHRAQIEGGLPSVGCELGRIENGWMFVDIIVRNRADVSWEGDRLILERPRTGKVVNARAAISRTASGAQRYDTTTLEPGQYTRRAAAYLRVARQGTQGPERIWGQSDHCRETFLVWLPPGTKSLSMRLSLRSNEAKQAAMTKAIHRRLSPTATTPI